MSTILPYFFILFFSTLPATPEIYTLSLHDALPISSWSCRPPRLATRASPGSPPASRCTSSTAGGSGRSEEHTSELQSHVNLVCRLLLEKKNISLACQCNYGWRVK